MAKVCIDAVGGDEPSEVVLAGCDAALKASESLEILLAGPEDVVAPFCASHERTEPLVVTEAIGMGEHPTRAVRTKRDSSIVRGCKAVREGSADAFFSAGSTGAILAAGTLFVGRVRGCARPALASVVPGLDGARRVMLDLGANADCRPEMLVEFALMGQCLAKATLGLEKPRVMLLSNGTEDAKGSKAAIAAHGALEAAKDRGVNFVGNCEGSDILMGDVDVIVCDGFTGNVALKSMEGTAKYISRRLKAAAKANPLTAVGGLLVKGAMKGLAADLSGDEYGGAQLLGLKGPVLIGHGATSEEAVKNGALAAERAANAHIADDIATVLA